MRARATMLTAMMLSWPAAHGLAQPPPPVVSPEVHADHRVTFRFRAPNARAVLLALEGAAAPMPMAKDEQGLWTLTTEPLEPDLYGYAFVADGVALIDPSNFRLKPNLINSQSVVHVPGPATLPWEVGDVPHGTVHHHFYASKVVGDQRDFYVYTPPGYDRGQATFPVLYLLHGYSDAADGWTAVGRAHVILDNLIARGQARPMLVVTPLGYGAPEIVTPDWSGIMNAPLRARSYERFRDALLGEVIPQVEGAYRVARDRESRAIAGLSMGGAESLFVGFNNLNKFAWVGAFSSGGLGEDFEATYPALSAKDNARLRLLWMACGTDDRLIGVNRKLDQWLKSKEVRHTMVETPGAHTWMVWRRNLAALVPMLFREPGR